MNRTEFVALLGERLRQDTTAAWLEKLRGHVPCAPIRTLDEALDEGELAARGMLAAYPHPVFEHVRAIGTPFTLAGYAPEYRAAPALDGDRRDILDELGYAADDIAALFDAGAFGGGS